MKVKFKTNNVVYNIRTYGKLMQLLKVPTQITASLIKMHKISDTVFDYTTYILYTTNYSHFHQHTERKSKAVLVVQDRTTVTVQASVQ